MNLSTKIFIFLVLLSVVSFIYFRDRYEEPIIITNPDNTTSFGCNLDNGYTPIVNPANQTHIQCYKEAGFGHIKYTFLLALSMMLWTGVGIVFYIEYKKRDESSVIQFLQDDYQTENKPIQKCPDTFTEQEYTWTFKGFDRVISSTEPVLFIGKNELVKKVGKNLLLWGRREEITPFELYHYLGKNARLFKRITGADVAGYISGKLVRKEETVPKIYFPKPLSYEILKSFYSLKGNYAFEANRFSVVIRMLFKMKRSIEFLDRQMDTTFRSMMLKGENYVAGTSRIGMEADKTRRTDSADSSRIHQQPDRSYEQQQRREI